MARKIVLDCDPGIDDAVALALALFDPRLDVLAVTACAGTVDGEQSTQNLLSIIERLDPPRTPRIGAALDPELGAAVSNATQLHGEDGLGNARWEPIARQHLMPADKLIADQLRAYPGEVTIVCTGPLTGIARLMARDPGAVALVDRIVIAGGSVTGMGNVTAAAEFNMHFDPQSARTVMHSATTKTLIPLEITDKLAFGWELIDRLPPKYSRAGSVMHAIVPHLFRTSRQLLGQETISLAAVLPILMLLEPLLFEWEEMSCDVETTGELTRGMLVFDRRPVRESRSNLEVACGIDIEAARDAFYNMLKFAGQVE
ncbi:MAG: nucleoside hydrolase [Pirellulales bacterium]